MHPTNYKELLACSLECVESRVGTHHDLGYALAETNGAIMVTYKSSCPSKEGG